MYFFPLEIDDIALIKEEELYNYCLLELFSSPMIL